MCITKDTKKVSTDCSVSCLGEANQFKEYVEFNQEKSLEGAFFRSKGQM